MKKLVAFAILAAALSTAAQAPQAADPAPVAAQAVAPQAPAEQAEQGRRPQLGLGIGITPLDAGGLGPTIEVYLPINVSPELRLEPSAGVFTNDQRSGGVDSSVVTAGLGAFYVQRVAAPTDVYVGGRAKLHRVTVESALSTETELSFSLAAVVGGEHFLGTNFSLGAEAQLGTYQNGRNYGAYAANDQGYFTTGVGFLRVYFK